jgi:hypothetical protein
MTVEKVFTPPNPLNTAVLFLVFNRLDTTKQVFQAIRQAKPPKLYVAADGARDGKEAESEKVQSVRDYILQNIDWECEVKTLFREENLGCKYSVSGAIDWFFESEEQGIILEDDCLPSQSFFWFCEAMLEKYKMDTRIFLVSGYNKQNQWKIDENDYFYSNFGGIWGWASWRRAWESFDVDMNSLNKYKAMKGFEYLLGKTEGLKRQKLISNAYSKNINSWAYPWAFARHVNNGLSCVPSKSLIKNIGFGEDATHTVNIVCDGVNSHDITFPLKNNFFFFPDRDYDLLFIASRPFILRVVSKLRRFAVHSKGKINRVK